jgi:hypothetical protein
MTHEEQIETLKVENRLLCARCDRLEREESERNQSLVLQVKDFDARYTALLKAVAENKFALQPPPQIILVTSEEEHQKTLDAVADSMDPLQDGEIGRAIRARNIK